MNGGDVENNFDNGTAVIPTLDSIQEFRLLSNTTDAEYGRATGAVVNVVTKSGTNQIHGDAYEFVRNDVFDARNYFNSGTKGALKQNQFGGTAEAAASSAIVSFTFADYQGTRQTTGARRTVPVPSDLPCEAATFLERLQIGFNPSAEPFKAAAPRAAR